MASVLETAIGETQGVLQPFFARPKLSTKLLSKPPFRFIHDIIVATMKSTGFPSGLFGLEELDSSKFKDSKAAKISFLTKLIHLVNVGNGAALSVSSTKILAGLEPLKTNILLSTFGRLAQDEKIDRNRLVQHCLSGKGIDEFHSSDVSLTNETNTQTEIESPVPEAIMKQVKSCNDDIEQTRVMISKVVAKPKCSDKLLSKPPFRFIHDLIMAIGKASKFNLCRIFSDDELVSSNVKEKQSKIQFLEKLVNFLETNLGISINVKPLKIISGLEPDRTRHLLQVFTVVTTTKYLAEPTPERLGVTQGEAAKSEFEIKEPANEDSEETIPECEGVQSGGEGKNPVLNENEKEAFSPNDDSRVKTFDGNDLPREDSGLGMVAEEAPVISPSAMATKQTDRPTTSRGGVPAVIKEMKDNTPSILTRPKTAKIEEDEGSKIKEVSREYTQAATEKETEDGGLSVFQKIIQEQKLNNLNRSIDEEEAKTNCLDTSFQSHRNIDDRAQKVILPAQMLDHNFESLADAIECIVQSIAPLGKYTNTIKDDIDTMLNERNHWIAEQDQQGSWDSMQNYRAEYLGPLQAKLKSLEVTVQAQVSEIKRLEASVRKNDKLLKKHGVTHAY